MVTQPCHFQGLGKNCQKKGGKEDGGVCYEAAFKMGALFHVY